MGTLESCKRRGGIVCAGIYLSCTLYSSIWPVRVAMYNPAWCVTTQRIKSDAWNPPLDGEVPWLMLQVVASSINSLHSSMPQCSGKDHGNRRGPKVGLLTWQMRCLRMGGIFNG